MIKSDYGHLSTPFYEEKLSQGLRLVFIPRKAALKSALLYIAQGGYPHDAEIASSKMPFGAAFYLEKMIFSPKTQETFRKMGALGTSHTDYSFTSFRIDSLKDVFAPLQVLLSKIATLDFSETDVEAYRASRYFMRTDTRLEKNIKGCLDNLYFASPLRLGCIPETAEGVALHASTLKKFLSRYYIPQRMTLMISGDFAPAAISEKVKALRLPSNQETSAKDFTFEENYEKPKTEFATIKTAESGTLLTFGFKFPARKTIYESYGQMLFDIYEILIPSLFMKNASFQKILNETSSQLVDAKILQGGEDTAVVLTLRTEHPNKTLTALTDYSVRLDKHVTHTDFERTLKSYFYFAKRQLSLPSTAVEAFASSYANHLPYTSLAGQVSRLSLSSYRKFLRLLSEFPKAVFISEGL